MNNVAFADHFTDDQRTVLEYMAYEDTPFYLADYSRLDVNWDGPNRYKWMVENRGTEPCLWDYIIEAIAPQEKQYLYRKLYANAKATFADVQANMPTAPKVGQDSGYGPRLLITEQGLFWECGRCQPNGFWEDRIRSQRESNAKEKLRRPSYMYPEIFLTRFQSGYMTEEQFCRDVARTGCNIRNEDAFFIVSGINPKTL